MHLCHWAYKLGSVQSHVQDLCLEKKFYVFALRPPSRVLCDFCFLRTEWVKKTKRLGTRVLSINETALGVQALKSGHKECGSRQKGSTVRDCGTPENAGVKWNHFPLNVVFFLPHSRGSHPKLSSNATFVAQGTNLWCVGQNKFLHWNEKNTVLMFLFSFCIDQNSLDRYILLSFVYFDENVWQNRQNDESVVTQEQKIQISTKKLNFQTGQEDSVQVQIWHCGLVRWCCFLSVKQVSLTYSWIPSSSS